MRSSQARAMAPIPPPKLMPSSRYVRRGPGRVRAGPRPGPDILHTAAEDVAVPQVNVMQDMPVGVLGDGRAARAGQASEAGHQVCSIFPGAGPQVGPRSRRSRDPAPAPAGEGETGGSGASREWERRRWTDIPALGRGSRVARRWKLAVARPAPPTGHADSGRARKAQTRRAPAGVPPRAVRQGCIRNWDRTGSGWEKDMVGVGNPTAGRLGFGAT